MTSKEHISWFWNASKNNRLHIALNSIVDILNVCTSLCFVWLSKQLIDIATHTSEGNMLHYTILFVTIIILQIFFTGWSGRLENQNDIRLRNRLQGSLFSHLMTSTWNGKERFHSGDIINRLEEDVRLVAEAMCKACMSSN